MCKVSRDYEKLNDYYWLYTQYVVKGRSSTKIANEVGCHKYTVINALKKHKIEIKPRGGYHGVTRGKAISLRPAMYSMPEELAKVLKLPSNKEER